MEDGSNLVLPHNVVDVETTASKLLRLRFLNMISFRNMKDKRIVCPACTIVEEEDDSSTPYDASDDGLSLLGPSLGPSNRRIEASSVLEI